MNVRCIIAAALIFLTLLGTGCFEENGEETGKELNAQAGSDQIYFFTANEEEEITAELDPSNSTGNIKEYAWDFRRDGPFEADSCGKIVSREYDEPGSYTVSHRLTGRQSQKFDNLNVFISYRRYENSTIEDDEEEEFNFPVVLPASRVYAEIRYDVGRGFVDNNFSLEIFANEGNSTGRDGTYSGERQEGNDVVKWVEIKGNFVIQYEMGTWKARVSREDSSGGTVDYSLCLEVDYDPNSEA